jgi:glycine/D-amino acid oxidase-like deaminating enzyme
VKRIAVIGCGFAGLATAWHLLNKNPNLEITLFDKKGIGSGASGIATGLLHPFMGRKANLSWRGLEGISSTIELLRISEEALGKSPILSKGLLRPCYYDEQKDYFQQTADSSQCSWFSTEKIKDLLPDFAPSLGGLWIPEGFTISCSSYLQGLWKACEALGATLNIKETPNLTALKEYCHVVVACGDSSFNFLNLPITFDLVKGHLLTFSLEDNSFSLPFSIVGKKYFVMDTTGKKLHLGASFERNFDSKEPSLEIAKTLNLEEGIKMLPCLKDFPILGCKAGIRLMISGRLPIAGKVAPKTWVITGFGAKGLLYHSWCAKQLAHSLINDSPDFLESPLRRFF